MIKKITKKPAVKPTKSVAKKIVKPVEKVNVDVCSKCACSRWDVVRWILTPVLGIVSTFVFTLLFTYIASIAKIPNRMIASCMDQMCALNKLFIIFIVSLALAFIPTYFFVHWIAPKRKRLSAIIFLALMAVFVALRLYGVL